MAVPGLHAVGLLLRMSALLDDSEMQTNDTQTSPPDQKAPRIVSRLHTLENESKICHQAFLPGEHLTIPSLPNITAVNALGGFSIARDKLAIIDGEGESVYFSVSLSTDQTPHSYVSHPHTVSAQATHPFTIFCYPTPILFRASVRPWSRRFHHRS